MSATDPEETEREVFALADELDAALSSTYVPRDELVQAAKTLIAARRLSEKLTPEEQSIVNAWVNPGSFPLLHYREMQLLGKNWPTLARAIDRLVWKAQTIAHS